jgi:glycosyltransferase involved in cell wall biosynthesis
MLTDSHSSRIPRKVCFIARQIAGRSGGAERVVIETANAIAARGHQVEILTHEKGGQPPFFPLRFGVTHTNLRRPDAVRSKLRLRMDRWREEKHNKIQSYRFPIDRLLWRSMHGSFWRRLERYINLHRPDVAIAFLPPSIVALGMIRPEYPLRRIASLHNVPERDLCDPARWDPNPFDRERRMSSLRRHDAITVLQPEFRDWFDADIQEKVSIIPNVVRQMTATRIARHPREKTVLSVGRLASVKRHDLLIDAWARIADEFPDWTLKIFGRGPLQKELAEQIGRLGLTGKVRLMGHTSKIDKEYLTASILAHPAEHEGWGLAASEAFAAGLPVIGFADCPGINHLVKHETNGLLIPEGEDSAPALAEALVTLMRDDARRLELGRAAPGTIYDYEPERVYDLWEDVLYEPDDGPGVTTDESIQS